MQPSADDTGGGGVHAYIENDDCWNGSVELPLIISRLI
jgi:hypothetical protein